MHGLSTCSSGARTINTKTFIVLRDDTPNYTYRELTCTDLCSNNSYRLISALQNTHLWSWEARRSTFSTLSPHADIATGQDLTAMRSRVALTAAHRSSRLSTIRMKPSPDAAALREKNTQRYRHRKLHFCVREIRRCDLLGWYKSARQLKPCSPSCMSLCSGLPNRPIKWYSIF